MTEKFAGALVTGVDLPPECQFGRAVFDSLKEAISIIDPITMRIIFVNNAFLQEVDMEEEAVTGRLCYEVSHKLKEACSGPAHACPMPALLSSGQPQEVRHMHWSSDGKKRIVEVSVSPVKDTDGRIAQVVHVCRDVTERWQAEEELKQSERKFRELFDSSLDGVFSTDKEGVYTMINRAGAEMFGHGHPSEMIGRQACEYWLDQDEGKSFVRSIRQKKFLKAWPVPSQRRDGSAIHIETTSRVIEDEEGRFLGIEGILRDVTGRIRTEEELKQNQRDLIKKHEELQRLFKHVELVKKEWELSMDCTGSMVILADREGKIKRCNRGFMEFAGKPYEEILWRDWAEVFSEKGLINDQMSDEKYGEAVELFDKGSERWFVLNTYPYEDQKSGITGSVLTLNNITEMRNMTQALEITNTEIEKNRISLQTALDELSHLIEQVIFKKDFSVRFSNPHIRKCSEVKNCGHADCSSYQKEAHRCWQEAGTFCAQKIQGVFAERLGSCSDCDVFKFATLDPIYHIGESFNNMMHILERQHIELEKAYNDLKDVQSQVLQQEKMASIGQLAAGVAHEINNPTGFIMSNLGSLQKYVDKLTEFIGFQSEAVVGLASEKAEEVAVKRKALKVDYIMDDLKSLVRESLDGAERIKKIVQDLKSFSRVDESELKPADINAGIESTVNIVWNELKYKAVVKKDYGDIPLTKCNPGQLNQVFMNILVNAAHAIDKQGEIGIRTWEEGEHINITISDTGCGIPAEKINRIFEPFYTTKEVGKGTGLGLSIAYDIIKKHKGEIGVQSEQGRGTTFVVRIPVVEG
jgi:PAS domain S-box-containing protein